MTVTVRGSSTACRSASIRLVRRGGPSEVSFRLRGPISRRLFHRLDGSFIRSESDEQIQANSYQWPPL